MTAQRRSWWTGLWDHLPAAINEFPLLTAGEQTKLTWARPIEALSDTPPPYADAVGALAADLGYFPRCILTPSYAGFLTRTTEKLVCCYGDRIHILEKAGAELRSMVYTQAAIDRMEFGSILLKAWLKIVGTDDRGAQSGTTIKFNAVTDFLFLPILNRWRAGSPAPVGGPTLVGGQPQVAASLADEQAKFDHLAKDHYKFMNVAKRVLLPGDRVLASIMQPELRAPVLALFGHTYTRMKAPAHIVVLTDRELIVAAEEGQGHWRDDTRYGSISTYLPLPKIREAAVHPAPDGSLQLVLQLGGDEQLALDFDAAQAGALAGLLALLRQAQAAATATP